MKKSYSQLIWISVAAIVIAWLLIAALGVSDLRVVTGVYMWIGLALSWNIIGGYAGYLSFGHAAFFGVGAYVTAILMNSFGWPFLTALLCGGLSGAILAIVIGIPTLRLSGAYFAIATWAFSLCLMQLANVLDITGGAYGISVRSNYGDVTFNVMMFILAWLVFAVTWLHVEGGRFGRKLEALRENETAAEMLGINTNRQKLLAFVLSALFPALFGGVFALWIGFIEPNAVFGYEISDPMVLMAILGGIGTVPGPVIAAIVLYLLNRVMWIAFSDNTAYLIIIGALTCVVVLFAPKGLMGLFEKRAKPRATTEVTSAPAQHGEAP